MATFYSLTQRRSSCQCRQVVVALRKVPFEVILKEEKHIQRPVCRKLFWHIVSALRKHKFINFADVNLTSSDTLKHKDGKKLFCTIPFDLPKIPSVGVLQRAFSVHVSVKNLQEPSNKKVLCQIKSKPLIWHAAHTHPSQEPF